MKKITLIALVFSLLLTTGITAQRFTDSKTNINFTEIGITVHSLEELDALDWEKNFSVFDGYDDDYEIRAFLKIDHAVVVKDAKTEQNEEKIASIKLLQEAIQKVKKAFEEKGIFNAKADVATLNSDTILQLQHLIASSEHVQKAFSKNTIEIKNMKYAVKGLKSEKEALIKTMMRSTESAKEILSKI